MNCWEFLLSFNSNMFMLDVQRNEILKGSIGDIMNQLYAK